MATYVLIHGSGHGGWCWRRVRENLEGRGCRVLTPTLTGLGERAHLLHSGVDLELQLQAGAAHTFPGPLGAIAQVHFSKVTLTVTQHVQFRRRAQAQRAVIAEPQHARQ